MTVYAYVEARRYVNGQWELKRVCCRVCTSDTVFTLDVGGFEHYDLLELLTSPADEVSTDMLEVAEELIKSHEPSEKRPTRHKEYQYFGLKACKQADGAKKAALPPGTCPPSEEGQKDNWSARCGNDSVGCAWLQSVAARLGDFIRVATKSFRTPINFTERQWTVVRDSAIAAGYLTAEIDDQIQESLALPHIERQINAARDKLQNTPKAAAPCVGSAMSPSSPGAGVQRQLMKQARAAPYPTPAPRSHAQQCLLAQQQVLHQESQAATGANTMHQPHSPAAQLLEQGVGVLGPAGAAPAHCMVPQGQQIPHAAWHDIHSRLRGLLVNICEGEGVSVQPNLTARQLQLVQRIAAGVTSTVYSCGLPSSTPTGSSRSTGSATSSSSGGGASSGNEPLYAVKVLQGSSSMTGVSLALWKELQTYSLVNGQQGFAELLAEGTVSPPGGGALRCLVMPLYKRSLDAACRSGSFPVGRLRPIIKGILQALAVLHSGSSGVIMIHFDIKPSNILLDGNDTPVLCDFGACCHITTPQGYNRLTCLDGSGQAVLASTTTITPRYAAPDVVRSQQGTPMSDCYSLAAVLAAAVVGDPAELDRVAPIKQLPDSMQFSGLDVWQQKLRQFARGDLWQEKCQGSTEEVQEMLAFARACIGDGTQQLTAAQLLQTPWMSRDR